MLLLFSTLAEIHTIRNLRKINANKDTYHFRGNFTLKTVNAFKFYLDLSISNRIWEQVYIHDN